MKPTIKYCLVLSVGILLGSIATFLPLSVGAAKQTSKLCLLKVFDDATIAVELQAGRQTNVLARLALQLPDHVMLVRNFDRSSAWYTNALWMIKAYYQSSGTQAPASIASALDNLPVEPPAMCRNILQEVLGNQIPNAN
jgi:hypothetical protein